ncbi:MAG: glycosyl hydrolase, partial [Paenibacillus sp.]|jgi:rhamnogalacturonyl hydrolase YesR|nr:glycosyl hydrolase [Paenibacillus sp.]
LLHGLAFPYFPETDGLRIDVPEGALSWQPVVSARNAAGFVDLNELYGGEAACAYGLTYYDTARTGLADLVLRIHHTSAVIVWIEGKEVYRSMSSGSQEIPFPSGGTRGQVLVKSVRSEVKWGFEAAIIDFSTDQRADELPDLDTWRGDEARWLYIGPFGLSNSDPRDLLDHAFDVEREVRFDRPYPTGEPGKFTYWRLSSPSTFVRPYMDGFFFGQWFYAIQVGLYGLLKAGETIGEAVLIQYVTDSMSVMAQYHDYALWDAQQFGVPSLIPRARQLEELDPCGAAGVMLLESYERTKEAAMLPVIQRLAEAVMNGVPRMEGGTFYRKETMWADDLFMSCPFLVRMGRSTGDARYYDEVIQQAAGFHRRLWMQDKRLYAHIYFPHEGINSRVPWGRGNGWVLLALTEILLHLPDEHPEREHVLVKFKELAEGIATYQADSGLWHQVLDECESYEETSCTAMFIVSIVRGIRHGWLDSGFLACVRRGWNGLLESCIDREGNVYGVCLGSGCSMDASYYYDIPTYINDDHGTGIVLLAASEMCELAKWQLHALT